MSHPLMVDAPLNDPDYEPKHPPVNGQIPDVVTRFGMRTQIRWFARFGEQLGRRADWGNYHCQSEHHRGPCCGSCQWEFEEQSGVMMDGWCCCRDGRIHGKAAAS